MDRAGRDRDEEFSRFVALRSGALLSSAYLHTGDRQRGEDLMQTALLKAYVAWPRLREPDAVEAYVRRTMVTTNVSWWRRRWRGEVATGVVPEQAAPETEASGDSGIDGRSEMWPHLLALPVRQRAALVLRYYEDLSVEQVATLMHCSVGTVKSQTSRGLATLRERMGTAATTAAGMEGPR